ncbi:Malate dehydrogenase [Mizuhopecten yessoensis]|uniref:Malate dehydrogenase n=1 Tax=Mizuhopecten yessoensis TaxID=6573 RepID=A0A210PSH8_MIZYE|nr:Malate dehydrogenase [Mizuhopecten yessoensis]
MCTPKILICNLLLSDSRVLHTVDCARYPSFFFMYLKVFFYRSTYCQRLKYCHKVKEDSMAEAGEIIVSRAELDRYVVECMMVSGASEDSARVMSDLLVTADYRGHYSHGLNRIDVYTSEVQNGVACGGGKDPTVVKETVATALIDGNNLLGPVVGKYAMDIAIQKAKAAGVGIVTVRGSNHYGIAGWYSLRATQQGLLGLSMTNSSPCTIPTRSKTVSLGTNPISMAAPGKHGDSFALDMATSSVAWGKVEVKRRKGGALPSGWATDKDGHETRDPSAVAGLLPLGGLEQNSGYKGYGLALMVEVLTSVLSGAEMCSFVRKWKTYEKHANLGHCFIAIDPEAFADGFTDRMQDLMDFNRNLEPVEAEREVLVAGDPERQHMTLCDKLKGIPYHPNQIEFLDGIAKSLDVKPLHHVT